MNSATSGIPVSFELPRAELRHVAGVRSTLSAATLSEVQDDLRTLSSNDGPMQVPTVLVQQLNELSCWEGGDQACPLCVLSVNAADRQGWHEWEMVLVLPSGVVTRSVVAATSGWSEASLEQLTAVDSAKVSVTFKNGQPVDSALRIRSRGTDVPLTVNLTACSFSDVLVWGSADAALRAIRSR